MNNAIESFHSHRVILSQKNRAKRKAASCKLLYCYNVSPFNPMSKTSARQCRCKPAAGWQIFADLDRFLGWHAVLSDSIGRHKHFFSLQIQQTLRLRVTKRKFLCFRQTLKKHLLSRVFVNKYLCVDLFFNKKMFLLRFT